MKRVRCWLGGGTMRVPAALGVLLLELSVVRLGAACDVPEGHTDPEVISPVKHQPSGGVICTVDASYEVIVRRCELLYCCGFLCTCRGDVYPDHDKCPGLFTLQSCYVEHRETYSIIKVCCTGYEENENSTCIKLVEPSLSNLTVSRETLTEPTTVRETSSDAGSGLRLSVVLTSAMLVALVIAVTAIVRRRRHKAPSALENIEPDHESNHYTTHPHRPALAAVNRENNIDTRHAHQPARIAVNPSQFEMQPFAASASTFPVDLEAGRMPTAYPRPQIPAANSADHDDTTGYLVPVTLMAPTALGVPQDGATNEYEDGHVYEEI